MRRALIILCAIVFAVGCAAAAAYLELKTYAVTPASPSTEEKVVLVGPGQPVSATAEILFRHGLIQSPLKFRLLARLQGYDRRLKAGEYGLKASMTPLEILEILERGQVKLYKVTLPEGLTASTDCGRGGKVRPRQRRGHRRPRHRPGLRPQPRHPGRFPRGLSLPRHLFVSPRGFGRRRS